MNALILGAGKVGYSIASLLSKERHNVTVVEPNPDRARVVEDALDVRVVVGNGACSEIINKCNIKSTDLLVAVTAHDEVNMLACLWPSRRAYRKPLLVSAIPSSDGRKFAQNPR